MPESNLDRARRGFEAALRGDNAALEDLLDPDVRWHGGDPEFGCSNRGEALRFMEQARRRRPRLELVDVVDAGEQVVVVLRRSSETGEPPELVANLTTFRDGRAVEMVHYADVPSALAAAGVPGEASTRPQGTG